MAYTLTGSSALGFDLARRPGGPGVAPVLGRALAATPQYASALAAHPPAPAHARQAAARYAASGDVRVEVDLTDQPTGSAGGPAWTDVLAALAAVRARVRAVRFGDSADLVALATEFLTGPAPDGTDVDLAIGPEVRALAGAHLRDAVLAALLRPGPHAHLADQLDDAYRTVGGDLVPEVDLGPGGPAVRRLLGVLRRDGLDVFDTPTDRRPPAAGQWAAAMHTASWAVELSGRTRPMMAAQLQLVVALRTGHDEDDCARGGWNTASGMVTAALVADLLPEPELSLLRG